MKEFVEGEQVLWVVYGTGTLSPATWLGWNGPKTRCKIEVETEDGKKLRFTTRPWKLIKLDQAELVEAPGDAVHDEAV